MGTLGNDKLTLIELAKRSNNGRLLAIAEVLNKENAILDDAIWIASNRDTSHVTTQRTYLPTGGERAINQGVARSASKTRQIIEPCSLIEDRSDVDEELINLSEDGAGFRFGEDMAHVEGLSQTLANRIIYGNRAGYPERINGLATRYYTLSQGNVHTCSGTGSDLSSIWIVQWGPNAVHMIYPKNTQAPTGGVGGMGIEMKDLGLQQILDENSLPYFVYTTQFKLRPGLVIRDDRCVQRICNIETSGSSNIFDPDKVVVALRAMPQDGAGAVIYANKTILAQMDINAMDKTNVAYQANNPFGRMVGSFQGIPVKRVDAILDTETALT